jgi:heme/copper-type cytochrome/quinol oxidase subunit 2
MMRRRSPGRILVAIALVVGGLLAGASIASAQCAMCSSAAASSSGVARGLAFSIFFLLGTLFLVVGWLVVLVMRSRPRAPETAAGAPPSKVTPSIGPAPLPTGHAPAEK